MPDPKEIIIALFKSTNKALPAEYITEELEKAGFAPLTIMQILQELEDSRVIISFNEAKVHGKPARLYRLITNDALNLPITRMVLEEEGRRRLLIDLISDSTGRYSTMPAEKVKEIFGTAARRLIHEDPKVLFLNFAKWLLTQHESETGLYIQSVDSGRKDNAEVHKRNIERLERYANSIFTRMLGIPARIRRKDDTLTAGPFLLSFNPETLENNSNMETEELSRYLQWSVHGESVLEVFSAEKIIPPIHIGGSDASIQPISLSSILPWQVEPSEISIITSVGVRYDIFKGARDIDRKPDPKVLAQYERKKAIEEGLLIPPSGTLGYRPEMESRIKEAAMDLRQYIKDFELMFGNEPAVSINFRDGRIFPLEHRLSDALQTDFHGEIVRSALKAFRNIVNMVGAEGGKTIYCGFVKRPGISIMAPLIMWYIGFGSGGNGRQPIDPEMTLDDFLRSPYSDNYIVNQLFSAIKEEMVGGVCLTFRVLRRFQSMEEPYIQNFEPSAEPEEWARRLKKYAADYLSEGIAESGVGIIATLCARAAIVEFYCSLIHNPKYEPYAQIPRIEFLLPYTDFKETLVSPSHGKKQIDYIKRLLSAIFYPGVLEPYPDSLFYNSTSPEVFVAPKPVCDAHISAKEIAKVYRDDFIELLVNEAKEYWRRKKWMRT